METRINSLKKELFQIMRRIVRESSREELAMLQEKKRALSDEISRMMDYV